MALTLSIPIRSKAEAIYYPAITDIERTYQNHTYKFLVHTLYGLESGYSISSDVLDYIIEKGSDAFNVALCSDNLGSKINQGISSLISSTYQLFYNAYLGYANFVQDWLVSGFWTYQWEYDFTGKDENYEGHELYGTAYGFRFTGIFNETIDIVLDSNGNFYGSEIIGNYTYSEDVEEIVNQGMPNYQDPNSFWIPSISSLSFNDLRSPYFKGKELHFFLYDGDIPYEYYYPDFRNCVLVCNPSNGWLAVADSKLWNYYPSSSVVVFYGVDGASNLTNNYRVSGGQFSYNNQNYNLGTTWGNYVTGLSSDLSYNIPTHTYTASYNADYSEYLGMLHNNLVSGSVPSIFLATVSSTPVTNPQPLPIETPIPITEIPSDPEDPLPADPVPNPIPVNPTPPPLRPVPSIVSGNDDLWPSVVELQNIEIYLSGYLSSLGDFEFPDLNTITESFAGSIVWVSALMSTLFNGSDLSILFAVLSSFFIVAALLGLYKWWNHK